MRTASLSAFIAGVALYPFAFYLTTRVVMVGPRWWIARATSVLSVALLLASVALAFFTPPSRPRKRIWWAVPAVAVAIVIVYFDWLGFGFAR